MNITISKSQLAGRVNICASKSYEQRVLAISALSQQDVIIQNSSNCADVASCKSIVSALKSANSGNYFNCGESALCARMFPPIIALTHSEFVLDGCGSLTKRNIADDLSFFSKTHAWQIEGNNFPFKISNAKLEPGNYHINGSRTSQLATGLILALSTLKASSTLLIEKPVSINYILLTINIIRQAGANINYTFNGENMLVEIAGRTKYKQTDFNVEGDWSNASFFVAASAKFGNIAVNGLNINSLQADKAILKVLDICQIKYKFCNGNLEIKSGNYNGFCYNATNTPDLIPPLCILAINAETESTIIGTNRLISKESNRLEAITQEISKLGVKTKIGENSLTIFPCKQLQNATLHSHNDHRIAMMLAILATQTERSVLEECRCVNKSYPDFWKDVEKCGGNFLLLLQGCNL